ncbi:MAG TPA: SpoIIE family protein phosphatase [Vicinamibacterales bacterium]|nr:SpoIIE family protein phosphatase [Vicinamibacterales bacterium]
MLLTAPDSARVLIADDQADVLDALRLLLRPEGFVTDAVASPEGVVESLGRGEYDLLLMDLNYARDTTSGREGLDLLARVRQLDATLPVVVMTGWGSMETAIEALRFGVRDFVQKPWDNQAVVSLVRTLTAERRRGRLEQRNREREQAEARDIQRGLLPPALPQVPGWDLAAACIPAAAVGGDLYDVFPIDPHTVAFMVADVAGKGVPAALLACAVQAAVRSAAKPGVPPQDVCAEVNRSLCGHIPQNRFVTFFYGTLDTRSGAFAYANAGHNPPLLANDGVATPLPGHDLVLGIDAGATWHEHTVTLSAGDVLFMYTDGLPEAHGADEEEEFGEERLAAAFRARASAPAAALVGELLAIVRNFGPVQEDDRTVVVVGRTAVE